MIKLNLSCFSPPPELVVETEINKHLLFDETVQWIGTPNRVHFFLLFFSTAFRLGFFALAIAIVSIMAGGTVHSINERVVFCLIIVSPLVLATIGIMKLSTMLTYFVTSHRISIKMAGTFFGINIVGNHLKDNKDGFIFFDYSIVTTITVLKNSFGFGEFDFSDFVNRDGTKRRGLWGNGEISPKTLKGPPYIIRILRRSWVDMFAFSLGDRFRGVSDVDKIAATLEANCRAKK